MAGRRSNLLLGANARRPSRPAARRFDVERKRYLDGFASDRVGGGCDALFGARGGAGLAAGDGLCGELRGFRIGGGFRVRGYLLRICLGFGRGGLGRLLGSVGSLVTLLVLLPRAPVAGSIPSEFH